MMGTGVSMFDKRVLALAHKNPEWPKEKVAELYAQDEQNVRSKMAAGNPARLSTALHSVALTSETLARDAIYHAGDRTAATLALSRMCYAKYLSDWTQYVLSDDPAVLKGRLDAACDQAALSIWLGFEPGVRMGCILAAALVEGQRAKADAVDCTHLNFCLSLCNAQEIVPAMQLLAGSGDDDIYAPLAFPLPGSRDKIAQSVINGVLEARIEGAYRSNMEHGDSGGHFYGGIAACVMPNELLAYHRWCDRRGLLHADVPPDPWIEYFAPFRYDSSVEGDPLLMDAKAFVEGRRRR